VKATNDMDGLAKAMNDMDGLAKAMNDAQGSHSMDMHQDMDEGGSCRTVSHERHELVKGYAHGSVRDAMDMHVGMNPCTLLPSASVPHCRMQSREAHRQCRRVSRHDAVHLMSHGMMQYT
jgi:hypothetical protein